MQIHDPSQPIEQAPFRPYRAPLAAPSALDLLPDGVRLPARPAGARRLPATPEA